MAKQTELTAPAGELRVVVVTPETTLLDDAADFVALPLFDGEIGIADTANVATSFPGFVALARGTGLDLDES